MIDSFENIKNLEPQKSFSNSDNIFLFYFDDKTKKEKESKIKQDIYSKKDLETNYCFILIYYNANNFGILFPREKMNNMTKSGEDLEQKILNEIQKSNFIKEINSKYNFDLRDNKYILKRLNHINTDNNNETNNYSLQFEIKIDDKMINKTKNIDNNTNEVFNNINNYNSYLFSEIGFKNIGSTCYMNSTLQCLIHVNELVIYFLDEYPKDRQLLLGKNKAVESKGNISKAFYNLISEIFNDEIDSLKAKNNRTKHPTKNPITSSLNEFKKIIGIYNSQFSGSEANDSKDLILYILRTIHEELNYLGDKTPQIIIQPNQFDRLSSFTYFNTIYNSRNLSKISVIFYGTYENTTTCLSCKNIYYNYQKFECISFAMNDYAKKKFDIYNGFKDNEKTQMLEGDNKFFCSICKKFCEGEIQSKIFQYPNKLLINIDYGKNKKYKPLNIGFEEEIDITKYVHFNFGYSIKYRILGVCSHYGSSGKFGHYVAYIRHKISKKWYKFNDSICTLCKKEEFKEGSPYLLLYEYLNN